MTKKEAIQELELLVQKRKTREAQKKISLFLKNWPQDSSLFQCLEWMRRLGLYKKAYQILIKDYPFSRQKKN